MMSHFYPLSDSQADENWQLQFDCLCQIYRETQSTQFRMNLHMVTDTVTLNLFEDEESSEELGYSDCRKQIQYYAESAFRAIV
jgi:hypothetical protein